MTEQPPNGVLYIDPSSPHWLPDVTPRDVRLGGQAFDICFRREGDMTAWTVVNKLAEAVIRRSPRVRSERLTGTGSVRARSGLTGGD